VINYEGKIKLGAKKKIVDDLHVQLFGDAGVTGVFPVRISSEKNNVVFLF
jgi:hypothetical protein